MGFLDKAKELAQQAETSINNATGISGPKSADPVFKQLGQWVYAGRLGRDPQADAQIELLITQLQQIEGQVGQLPPPLPAAPAYVPPSDPGQYGQAPAPAFTPAPNTTPGAVAPPPPIAPAPPVAPPPPIAPAAPVGPTGLPPAPAPEYTPAPPPPFTPTAPPVYTPPPVDTPPAEGTGGAPADPQQ